MSERVNIPPAIDPLIDLAVLSHRSTSCRSLQSPFPLLALDSQGGYGPKEAPVSCPTLDAPNGGVEPERSVSISADLSLRPAPRTGRATSIASGSPRAQCVTLPWPSAARSMVSEWRSRDSDNASPTRRRS